MLKNVLIFANCQGILYKNVLESTTKELIIEHVISYENLDNFKDLVEKFRNSDILIIQPIQNEKYKEFMMDSLYPILKSDCLVIKIPFIRFDGFWPKNDEKELLKFAKAAVMFFPNIKQSGDVSLYLTEDKTNADEIKSIFSRAVDKLFEIEKTGDIEFVGFFLNNYKKYPLFRDPYHPTYPVYLYLANQILNVIRDKKNITFVNVELSFFNNIKKEYGHYKPIKNIFSKTLGLKYDLSSYFIIGRYEYLVNILNYEDSGVEKIKDLSELRDMVLNV